jgi:hypothetical protein
MKKRIAILWLACILLHTGSRIGILVGFEINRDVIATTLCINRDEPVKKCMGKCFLAQQLKTDKEKEQQDIANIYEYLKEITLFLEPVKTPFPLPLHHTSHYITYYLTAFFQTVPSDIFHPPKM